MKVEKHLNTISIPDLMRKSRKQNICSNAIAQLMLKRKLISDQDDQHQHHSLSDLKNDKNNSNSVNVNNKKHLSMHNTLRYNLHHPINQSCYPIIQNYSNNSNKNISAKNNLKKQQSISSVELYNNNLNQNNDKYQINSKDKHGNNNNKVSKSHNNKQKKQKSLKYLDLKIKDKCNKQTQSEQQILKNRSGIQIMKILAGKDKIQISNLLGQELINGKNHLKKQCYSDHLLSHSQQQQQQQYISSSCTSIPNSDHSCISRIQLNQLDSSRTQQQSKHKQYQLQQPFLSNIQPKSQSKLITLQIPSQSFKKHQNNTKSLFSNNKVQHPCNSNIESNNCYKVVKCNNEFSNNHPILGLYQRLAPNSSIQNSANNRKQYCSLPLSLIQKSQMIQKNKNISGCSTKDNIWSGQQQYQQQHKSSQDSQQKYRQQQQECREIIMSTKPTPQSSNCTHKSLQKQLQPLISSTRLFIDPDRWESFVNRSQTDTKFHQALSSFMYSYFINNYM